MAKAIITRTDRDFYVNDTSGVPPGSPNLLAGNRELIKFPRRAAHSLSSAGWRVF